MRARTVSGPPQTGVSLQKTASVEARRAAAEQPALAQPASHLTDGGFELDEQPYVTERVAQTAAKFEAAKEEFRLAAVLHPVRAVTDDRGRAEFTLKVDGKVAEHSKARWYLNPDNWKRSPAAARAELIAQGKVGQPIAPHGEISYGRVSPEVVASLAPHSRTLVSLEEASRLVADLGARGPTGEPTLQFVTALEAIDLIASGRSVFALVGKPHHDSVHEYTVDARNWANTQSETTEVKWVERTFEYEKVPLKTAADLARGVPAGKGLPAGMAGVYRDLPATTVCVAERNVEQATRFLDQWNRWSLSKEADASSISRDPVAKAALVSGAEAVGQAPNLDAQQLSPMLDDVQLPNRVSRWVGMDRLGALFGGAFGVILGSALAPALGPVGPLGGAAAGATAGRLFAKVISRHESNLGPGFEARSQLESDQRYEEQLIRMLEDARARKSPDGEALAKGQLVDLYRKYHLM